MSELGPQAKTMLGAMEKYRKAQKELQAPVSYLNGIEAAIMQARGAAYSASASVPASALPNSPLREARLREAAREAEKTIRIKADILDGMNNRQAEKECGRLQIRQNVNWILKDLWRLADALRAALDAEPAPAPVGEERQRLAEWLGRKVPMGDCYTPEYVAIYNLILGAGGKK